MTFAMISHLLPPHPTDEQLKQEQARLEQLLAAHLPKRPDWRDINARKAWAERKETLEGRIRLIQGILSNRWRPVEVVR